MKIQAHILFILLFTILVSSCRSQPNVKSGEATTRDKNSVVGGPFENGEFMYIGMPDQINSVDTSEGWTQKGQKLLITGTMYKLDGKTPAPNVILYYYHTDVNGLYAQKPGLDPRVVRHGYIRGWVKSDLNGKYAIYTVRPASYPGESFEAHIHPAIKEPEMEKEYYIDEFVFDDDKFLTGDKRKKLPNRGGSGILRLYKKGDLQIAEHDIILGLNIPNYPVKMKAGLQSGLQVGEDQPSFMPYHTYGPDKGSRACPVCKYGRYQGIIYFVGNSPDWTEIKRWLAYLEQQSKARSKYLKAYFVYGNENNYTRVGRDKELARLGEELQLKHVALTFVPSFSDPESEVDLSKINQKVGNTFIVYRNRTIIRKYINFAPTDANMKLLAAELDANKGAFFDLEQH